MECHKNLRFAADIILIKEQQKVQRGGELMLYMKENW